MTDDISRFDPTRSGPALLAPLFAENRLVMFAENTHPDPVNLAVMENALQAMHDRVAELQKTDPQAKAAFFYELSPDKNNAQARINAFYRSNDIKDLGDYYTDPDKQPFCHFIIKARALGIPVFLVDDEKSRAALEPFQKRLRDANDQLRKARDPASPDTAQLKAMYNVAIDQIYDALKKALPARNETTSTRIASIMNGTNTEPRYQGMIADGGFAIGASQNGSDHLAATNDVNEQTGTRMGADTKICTVELDGASFSPTQPAITLHPEAYKLRVGTATDAPDISLNINKAHEWLFTATAKPQSTPSSEPHVEAPRLPNAPKTNTQPTRS